MPGTAYSPATRMVGKLLATMAGAVIVAVASAAANAAPALHQLYFTAAAMDGVPSTTAANEFDCSERVYAVVELAGLSATDHRLETIWIDPRGRRREHTHYRFKAFESSARLWAWLELHRPAGATIGSLFDPALGMENFIGEWRVKVLIDGHRTGAGGFRVLC